MLFEVTQHFTAPPRAVVDLFTDPAYYDDLPEFSRVGRPELVGRSAEGHRVTMRVRYRFTADLPAGADKLIDKQKLTWVEETVYDLDALTAASRLLPDNYPDRLSASARRSFARPPGVGASAGASADEGGTVAVTKGELTVRVRFVGGRVEGAIVDGLREHLRDEATLVNERLPG